MFDGCFDPKNGWSQYTNKYLSGLTHPYIGWVNSLVPGHVFVSEHNSLLKLCIAMVIVHTVVIKSTKREECRLLASQRQRQHQWLSFQNQTTSCWDTYILLYTFFLYNQTTQSSWLRNRCIGQKESLTSTRNQVPTHLCCNSTNSRVTSSEVFFSRNIA